MKSALIWLLLSMAAIGVVVVAEAGSVPDGTIYGHVYDADTKKPLSMAFVYCQEVTSPKATTDSMGYYAIQGDFLPSRTYKVECTKYGYKSTQSSVMTDQDRKAEVNFYLESGTSIEVEVTEETENGATDKDRRSLQEYMQQIRNPTLRTNEYWNSSIAACAPGTIQAACPASYSCVDCNGQCYDPGTELSSGIVCTAAGKWNWVLNCPPDCGISFLDGTCACSNTFHLIQ